MTPVSFATPEDIHSARPDVPLQTIRRHMREGVIPGAVKIGRSWVVPLEAAEEYVSNYLRYARKPEAGSDPTPPVGPTPPVPPEEKA